MPIQSPNKIAVELFAGGGEMGARMRALDWSKTPLGPVETWPQSLKTSVSICLNSRFAILLWWGPELVKIYNNAYIELIGNKHPKALGSPGRAVWPEIWDTISPLLESVTKRGDASRADDLLLLLERHGYPEECYFTFSYSPIREESGGIGGVFTPVLETSGKVIAERRMRTLRELAAIRGGRSHTALDACSAALEVLSANTYDCPFASIYLFDRSPDAARQAANLVCGDFTSAEITGLPKVLYRDEESWIPYDSLSRGETCVLRLNGTRLDLPNAPWGVPPDGSIAVPIQTAETAEPVGFLLGGISVRKRLDAPYRDFYQQAAEEIAGAIRKAEMRGRESKLLAEAEAERGQMRELFANVPAAIMVTTGPQHRIVLTNQRHVELLGRSDALELLGKTIRELMPEIEEQGFIDLLDGVYNTGVPFIGNEVMARLRRGPNGAKEERYFNFVYQPHRNAESKTDGIVIHASEVTEQVLSRRMVEEREAQFRVLSDSIPQLAWMANSDGSIDWYNRRWYEYTGTNFEQMQGWGWQSVHDPEVLPEVIAHYRESLETGNSFNMEFPLRGADGVFRRFLTLALPVRDAEGKIVRWFGTNTDIEAQQKAEAALRQSEKLAAVGRLAASIAHEINNPLEGVTNLVYLARSSAVNEETKFFLEQAESELKRVSQITNQTLRFHKQQSAPAPTSCIELLDSILTLYGSKLSRANIDLKLDKQDCPALICYAGEIRQVLANLLGNALDAMPKGGTLWLRVRPATNWRNGKKGIRFTVADTGHGMSPATLRRIYEPFFTTKGETGTGLGLWVSAEIIDNHGGSIHVRSRAVAGKSGTAFTLIFPYEGARSRAAADKGIV